jgi:predicted permease
VLLIACSNLANALMARSVNRRREIAIRSAIGAGRARVVAHLLAENLLLFLVGGAGGVGLAFLGTGLMTRIPLPPQLPLHLDLAPDLRVLTVALLLTLAVGLVFGLVPAFHGTRFNLVPALKAGRGAGEGRRARLRRLFVAGQTSMSVLLLILAFLLVRSLRAGVGGDPGFDADGVVVAGVDLGPHGYSETEGREFFDLLLERMRANPAVEAAGLSMQPIGIPEGTVNDVSSPDAVPEEVTVGYANWNVIGLGFLETMGIEVVAGRGFESTDGPGSPDVVLVTESLAEGLWPGKSPIGRRIRVDQDRVPEVVGVLRDGRYLGLTSDPRPYFLFPHSQRYASAMELHIRTAAPPDRIVRELREEVRALDPNVAVEVGGTLRELASIFLLPQWFASTVVGIFGLIGMALAALGTYGVLAYQVAQRTREFGVRRALGAGREGIVGLVVRQGAVLAAWGCGLGVLAGGLASHGIRSLLFGVGPLDPLTFAAVPVGLFLVALLASYLPASRAARIQPVEALREE